MANFNFNKVILGGRLTADPELKQTQQGTPVTSFKIAVNRKGKEASTDFFTCVAWRNTAEFICKYFKKGSAVCVVGELQTRSYTEASTGKNRTVTEVMINEANFVDSRNEAPAQSNTISVPERSQEPPKFEELGDDDELPF